MKIRYTNKPEDALAFQNHLREKVKMLRLINAFTRWAIPVFLMTIALVNIGKPEAKQAFIGALVLSLIWIFFSAALLRLIQKAISSRLVDRAFTCEHELEITADYLVERSPNGETRTKLTVLRGVERTQKHAFIFVSEHAAHIVRLDRVDEGNAQEFLRFLEEAMNSARSTTS